MNIVEVVNNSKIGDKFGLILHREDGSIIKRVFDWKPDECVYMGKKGDTYLFEFDGRIHKSILPLGEDNMKFWIYEM